MFLSHLRLTVHVINAALKAFYGEHDQKKICTHE